MFKCIYKFIKNPYIHFMNPNYQNKEKILIYKLKCLSFLNLNSQAFIPNAHIYQFGYMRCLYQL